MEIKIGFCLVSEGIFFEIIRRVIERGKSIIECIPRYNGKEIEWKMNFIGMRNFILDGGENLWEIGKSLFSRALHLSCVCDCNGY